MEEFGRAHEVDINDLLFNTNNNKKNKTDLAPIAIRDGMLNICLYFSKNLK